MTRLVAALTLAIGLSTVGTAAPAEAEQTPTVQIDSPSAATTLGGMAKVTVTAAVDPTGNDRPARVRLLIGGRLFSGPGGDCAAEDTAPDPYTCTTSFSWDTTGGDGPYTLQAVLDTAMERTYGSAPVVVDVDNAGPAVHIISPGDQGAIKGVVSVVVTGTVDPEKSGKPDHVALIADGKPVAGATGDCPDQSADPNTCTVTIPWDTQQLGGNHTLRAELFTVDNRSASSFVVHLQSFSATRTKVTGSGIGTYGKRFIAGGRVSRVRGGTTTLAGLRVRVVYKPVGSAAQSAVVVLKSDGWFSARFVARGNGTLTATTVGSPFFGSSTGTEPFRARAWVSCKMAHSRVQTGVIDPGACLVQGLPKGTKVVLQYSEDNDFSWHKLGSGPAPAGGFVRFGFGSYGPGSFGVRLVTASNAVFLQSTGNVMHVEVDWPAHS